MYSPGAFIPIDRRIAIAKNIEMPEEGEGAALFADISGFTPLTEAIMKERGARRGVEELTSQINAVYSALISEVHRYRGSVIGFSGDAITCWFGSWTIFDRQSVIVAVACALAMQKTMRLFSHIKTPSGKRLSLGIRICVTAGEVRRFLVGLPHLRRFDVLAGDVVNRLPLGTAVAKRGEVVVGNEVLRVAADVLQVSSKRKYKNHIFGVITDITGQIETYSWQETTQNLLEVSQADAWLPPAVKSLLESGQEKYIGEFRPAAALFVKFEGIDYQQDINAGKKLDFYVRKVQEILDRQGGSLIQLTTGDKGSYLYASFGAPIAYENNSYRAMCAAEEIVALSKSLDFINHIHLGLTSGMMRVGFYGSPTRRTYGVLGKDVNLAAKLMVAAKPSQILVNTKIIQELKNYFVFRPSGGVKISRSGETLPGYEYVRKKEIPDSKLKATRSQSEGIFIGRDKESANFSNWLEEQRESTDQPFLIIEGEAGIGKSSFIEWISRASEESGFLVFRGQGVDLERMTPYYAWKPVYDSLLGFDQMENPGQNQTSLQELFQGQEFLVDLLPLGNEEFSVQFPETKSTVRFIGKLRKARAVLFLSQLLVRIEGDTKKVIIFDDVQWFDEDSWALLRKIHALKNNVSFVLATNLNSEAIRKLSEELIGFESFPKIRLGRFDDTRALDLLKSMVGHEKVTQSTADMILEKTEGHPLYMRMLTNAIINSGLSDKLDSKDGEIAVAKLMASMKTPGSVASVVTGRIDSLTPEEQLTLKVASVIGPQFNIAMLREVHPPGINLAQILENLNNLVALGIVRKVKRAGEKGVYKFANLLTHEVSYNRLLFSQRRKLHRAVALWYESSTIRVNVKHYLKIAYHWQMAEVLPQYLKFLEKAGQTALENKSYEEATRHFISLLNPEYDETLDDLAHARVCRQLSLSYLGLNKNKEAQKALYQGFKYLGVDSKFRDGKLRRALRDNFRKALHRTGVIQYEEEYSESERISELNRYTDVLTEIESRL